MSERHWAAELRRPKNGKGFELYINNERFPWGNIVFDSVSYRPGYYGDYGSLSLELVVSTFEDNGAFDEPTP